MKTVLITFGHDRSWYPAGMDRLCDSFRDNGYDGAYMRFTHESQLGCPAHTNVPYAFKAYALAKAYRDGFDRAIWADSSVKLVKPYSAISAILDHKGYMLFNNGWNTGQWCADHALEKLGITREESFKIPHLMACVMGFDFRQGVPDPEEGIYKFDYTGLFAEIYFDRSNDGTFKGAWTNKNNEVSKDPRVLGHRHDQTAASVIATKLGMTDWINHGVYYDEKPGGQVPETAFFTLKHGA